MKKKLTFKEGLKLVKMKKKKVHKIGKHGAVGMLYKEGLYCVECGKKIKDEK